VERSAESAFPAIRQHVLLQWASAIQEADDASRSRLNPGIFEQILENVPDAWLLPEPDAPTPDAKRAAYTGYFARRLLTSSNFVQEALRARALLV
jgi:hypothetical protein